METLFIKPEEQDEEVQLFEPREGPPPITAPLSEHQKYTTSLLAVMSKRWNTDSDSTLASHTGLIQNRINSGEEQNIRNEIADDQRQGQLRDLTEQQISAIGRGSIFTSEDENPNLRELLEEQAALQAAPPNQYALEQEGIDGIQEASLTDPANASAYSLDQSSLDAAADVQKKLAVWNRFINEKTGEVAQSNAEWWAGFNPFDPKGSSVIESILDTFWLPGQSWWAQTAGSDKDTAWLPGANLTEQVSRLNALPFDAYVQELPKVWDKVLAQSGILKSSPSVALGVLRKLGPTSDWGDAAMANFEAGFDVATTIPFAAAAKLARRPINIIQMSGNRKMATQAAAAAVKKDAEGLPDQAAGGLGELSASTSGGLEASIPSYVKTDMMPYVTPWVGIPSDVADAIRAIDEAAAKVATQSVAGAAPEVAQKNLIEHIETLQTRFRREGEDIADIHKSPDLTLMMAELKASIKGFGKAVDDLEEAAGTRPIVRETGGTPARSSARDIEEDALIDKHNLISEAQKGVMKSLTTMDWAKMPIPRLMNLLGATKEQAIAIRRGDVKVSDEFPLVQRGPVSPVAERPPMASVENEIDLNTGLPSGTLPEIPPILEREFKDRLDIHQDSSLGVQTVSFYLGNNARAGGYMTAELAHEGAAKRGLVGYKVVKSNGQHYIKVTEIVPDSGSATPQLNDDLYPVNMWTQYLRNPQQVLPDLVNDARLVAFLNRTGIEQEIFQPLAKRIHALSPKQLKRHNKIVVKGQDQQKVFKVDELAAQYEAEFGRGPTDKEIIAYYAHISSNVATDAIFNDYLHITRAKGGWVTGQVNVDKAKSPMAGLFSAAEDVRFSTPRMTMREVQNPDWGKTRIFDFDDNLTIHPGEGPAHADLRKRAQEKWASGNYRLLELEEEIMHNGEPVRFVLAHKTSSAVGPLERRQRKSAPWGRKENLNKHFVAQARTGKFRGSDQTWAANPVIHLSERTATRAKARVKQLEEARMAWNKEGMYEGVDEVTRRKIIETAVESMEKWAKLVDEGTIPTHQPFEYVEDRVLPSAYNNLPEGTQRWFDQEWTGSDRYFSSRRELYYQTDRDMLLDSSENRARNLDPTRVLNRAMNTAINTKAFAAYNQNVIEDWVRRLPEGSIVEGSVGYSKDPWTTFFHGRFTEQFKAGNRELYQRLESNRRIHYRFMNFRNGEQTLRQQFNARIASLIDGKGVIRDRAATKFYDSMSRNPVDAVQGFVFDSYLGFYNPDQFFVQAQTAILAQATHPIYGVQALTMTPWMTHMLLNRSDNLLDLYAKRLKYIHGLPEAEFKVMVNALRESKWMNVQGSNLQLDYLTNRIGGGTIGKAMGSFRRGGRVLFNLAERYNRLTGFQIAWHDVRKYNPGLKPGSPEFMMKVRQMTDGLTGNMTAASKAAWQDGLAAVPTKFLAYQAHVLENMLPKSFGGSTKLRGEQKFRLAMGQLGLYGLGGGYGLYSLVGYVQDSFKMATGREMTDTEYQLATKGVFDAMASTIFGTETDMASRVGFGSGMLNWIEKLTSQDFATSVDIFGGPTASLGSNWVDAVTRISRFVASAPLHEISQEEWQLVGNEFMSSFKAWSTISQAWAIHSAGQLIDKKTRQPIVATGELDALARLLGFPLGAQTEFYREIKSEKARDQLSDEIAQQLASLYRLGFQALENGENQSSFNYQQSAGRIYDLMGDDYELRQMVQRKLTQLLNYNDYNVDTMTQRVMKNQGREPRAGRQ